jgi:hypothetical protein
MDYSWPGNVQLRNVWRELVFARDEIGEKVLVSKGSFAAEKYSLDTAKTRKAGRSIKLGG